MKNLNKRAKSMVIEPLTTDELKSRFRARSVPLETDFHALIDVAECGRRAVGLNPEQTLNTSSGLMLDRSQQLLVKPNTTKGITVDGSGVGVVANAGKGITVDGSGVGVVANAGKGITVDGSGVGVVANAGKGITVDGGGVGVVANAGKGIRVDESGVGADYIKILALIHGCDLYAELMV
ncbi:hypothetical protein [Enterobacter roggenkampii]|uniref:hypothetical protein n=1 Tax=Enterobacter roggenkampii TaxID=1812935 RepID=UPI00084C53F0|nr:hypothetical protein [Enterobacter roggenkampii]AOP98035.1 hypothetical protein BFV67_22955 [Enterobacter roggenkampii]QWZ75363.1 hypothetical protein I6L60_22995 [Enterobacter roggenkampii]